MLINCVGGARHQSDPHKFSAVFELLPISNDLLCRFCYNLPFIFVNFLSCLSAQKSFSDLEKGEKGMSEEKKKVTWWRMESDLGMKRQHFHRIVIYLHEMDRRTWIKVLMCDKLWWEGNSREIWSKSERWGFLFHSLLRKLCAELKILQSSFGSLDAKFDCAQLRCRSFWWQFTIVCNKPAFKHSIFCQTYNKSRNLETAPQSTTTASNPHQNLPFNLFSRTLAELIP